MEHGSNTTNPTRPEVGAHNMDGTSSPLRGGTYDLSQNGVKHGGMDAARKEDDAGVWTRR